MITRINLRRMDFRERLSRTPSIKEKHNDKIRDFETVSWISINAK